MVTENSYKTHGELLRPVGMGLEGPTLANASALVGMVALMGMVAEG
jgi:hypothetical protein